MVAKNLSKSNESASQDDLAARLSRNMTTRRRALGLTQAQVAERLSLDTETVSRFERGKHLPSLTTLERLAGLLLTTVGELLAEKPHEANDEALAITAWLSALQPEDKAFAQGLLKQCCDYLAVRRK
jgi:transcriptional regulator with XRE-family HTH domain